MATGYFHRPLDRAQNEIRLLCFDAGGESAECFQKPLRCTIKTLSLLPDPLPEYYAVSYTWGDSKTRGSLVVDGENVTVPANAAIALRHLLAKQLELRRNPNPTLLADEPELVQSPKATEFNDEAVDWPSTEVRFWLDAICINQHDLEEKSWQLLLISDIYSQAQEVCIWLGEDENGVGQDIEHSISSIVTQCKHETNDLTKLFETVWSLTPRELSPRSALTPLPILCNLGVIRSVYASPWFQRLWVLQESILARNARCYYGSHSVDFREIALAARWIWYRTYGRLYPGDQQYSAHTIGIQNAATMWDVMSTPFIVPRVLSNLLLLATRFDVADPRDKIYAVLGLLNDTDFAELEEGLLPDYSLSLAELYTRVTRAIIETTQSLFIMRIGSTLVPATGRMEDAPELPSWVPRFDWIHDLNKGSSCAIRPTRKAQSSDSRIRVRILEGLPDILTVEGTLVDTISCTMAKCLDARADRIEAHVSNAWKMAVQNGSEKHCDSLEKAFAFTICTGRNKASQDLNSDPHFINNCAAFFSTCGKPCFRLSDYFSRLTTNGTSCFTDHSQEIPRAMAQNSRNLRFFVSADGRLGMGGKMVRQGDNICIVPGCDVPIILRRDGPLWRYIGDAYVHDLMDAEFGDRESRVQWFNIH